MDDTDLVQLATRVVERARALGADEVTCIVSEGSHVTIQRRGGKVEQATEAHTRSLTVAVLRDDRYSSSSTSDLRPAAVETILERTLASTHFLEPEPAHRLPDGALCGRGVSAEQLDQLDPAWASRTAADRSTYAARLEEALQALHRPDVASSAVYSADGYGRTVRVMSNGFADTNEGAWFAAGGEMTLVEGDKRPESAAYYAARYLGDLPPVEAIAAEIDRRTRERLGAGPIASGPATMVLPGRAAGRILGLLTGPLSGGALQQQRSCLAGKLGARIGSDRFTLVDDPTLPRGLGSRPWDGDGLRSRIRTVIENGVLQQYNLGVYHARKLGMEPTSGSRSNWLIPPGERSFEAIVADLPRAIEVTGFLGGNSNAATGDFSLGIRGVLWENGEPVRSLAEMNVSGNVLEFFQKLVEVGNDPWPYASVRSPTLVFEGVQFSGT